MLIIFLPEHNKLKPMSIFQPEQKGIMYNLNLISSGDTKEQCLKIDALPGDSRFFWPYLRDGEFKRDVGKNQRLVECWWPPTLGISQVTAAESPGGHLWTYNYKLYIVFLGTWKLMMHTHTIHGSGIFAHMPTIFYH